MRRDHVAQPPPRVEKPVGGHGEDAEQGDYRRPAQPVVGALGGSEALLQIGILLAAHFADDGADAIHGGLAAIGPQHCQRAGSVAVPVKRDRLVDLGEFLRNRGPQRLELPPPLRIRRRGRIDRRDFRGQSRDSRAVGVEVGILACEEKAALAGLGVLDQRQRSDNAVVQFEGGADSVIFLALRLDKPGARADDGGKQRRSQAPAAATANETLFASARSSTK